VRRRRRRQIRPPRHRGAHPRQRRSLCLVALGAPKQELLADALSTHCPSVGFLCIGAALSFIAGHPRRAPLWMRRSGLEWLWRLAAEPHRLAPLRRLRLCLAAAGDRRRSLPAEERQ